MAGTHIAANVEKIFAAIGKNVTLVAVSKFHSAQSIQAAAAAGVSNFGENYAQEALEKMKSCKNLSANWHFIGGIQSNKIKLLVGAFSLLQSVDDLEHVKKISTVALSKNIRQDILIQINVAQEKTKSGVSFANLVSFYESAKKEPGVLVKGLMGLPPLESDLSTKRKLFKAMRSSMEELKLPVLSMGTSHDYRIAIDEGSTMVRIGTEIFGERK